MASINESILTALEQGHDPQSIIEYLKNSDKQEHQDWYNNYSANMQNRSEEKNVSKSNDGLLGFIEQNPKTSAAVGAAVLTAPIAIRGYNAYQERKTNTANAKLNERRVAAYENQVAKMGAAPFDEGQPAGNISSDPLVEQRIRKAAAEADLAELKLKQARDSLEPKPVVQPTEVTPRTNLTPEQVQARMADLPKPSGVSPSFSQYQPNVNAPTGVPPTTSGIPQSAQQPVQAPVQQPNTPVAPPELAGPPQQQFPPRPMASPPLESPPQQQFPPAPPATPVETAEKLIEGQPLAIAQKKGLQPMPKDLMFNGEPVTPGGRQVLTAFGYSQNPELAMQRYQGLVEALGKQPTAGPKGGAIVEAPQYEAFLDKQVGASRYPLSKDFYAAKKGATAGTMKEFTGPVAPKQAGGISPAMALNLAGNALGAVNIGKQLKQGDYSGAGVDAFIQLLSNLAPRLGLGAALMSPGNVSSGTLNSPEAQELMKRAKKPY